MKKIFLIIFLIFFIIFVIFFISNLFVSENESTKSLETYNDSISKIISLLNNDEKDKALKELYSLQRSIIKLKNESDKTFNGELKFEGDGSRKSSKLTDPFFLPKGVYKIIFKTKGFGTVRIYDYDNYSETLFSLFPEEAINGAEKLYKNTVDKELILEFSNLSDYYELYFEKLN